MTDLIQRLEKAEQGSRDRKPLPNRAQINAIADIPALEDMRDEIDRRIARIETDLDYREDTDDWERRAMSALSLHRYTVNLINRRLAALRKGAGPSPFASLTSVPTAERQRTECHALSWALIDGDVPEAAGDTVEEIDAALERLSEALEALEADRADEVRRFSPGARDEGWMTEANSAIRRARAARHDLTLKKANLRKLAKVEQQRAMDRERERRFIDEARAVLPRETFLLIWDRVDRKQIASAIGEGEG